MEQMWSPWRSQHIDTFKHPKPELPDAPSLFARLAAESRDEENLILWRGREVFVLMNLYPYNNGHLMIAPYREAAHYDELTESEQTEIAAVIAQCIRWLRHTLNPEGFNVGMNLGAAAGAGVPRHVHVHVVPRWNGDTNFMPTIAEVKVVPQAIRETYARLRAAIDALEDGAAS